MTLNHLHSVLKKLYSWADKLFAYGVCMFVCVWGGGGSTYPSFANLFISINRDCGDSHYLDCLVDAASSLSRPYRCVSVVGRMKELYLEECKNVAVLRPR